jgi:hypothetical protein
MAAEFEALLRTTPDQAAEIICRGVDRGKARILVGPDAYVFDALTRIAPTHYYDIMALLEKRLRPPRAEGPPARTGLTSEERARREGGAVKGEWGGGRGAGGERGNRASERRNE